MNNLEIFEYDEQHGEVHWRLEGLDGVCEVNEEGKIDNTFLCDGPFDMKPDTMRKVRDEVQQWLDYKPSRDEDYEAWNNRYEYYRDVWKAWGDTPAGHGIDHAFPSVYHLPDEVAVEGTVEFVYHGWSSDREYRRQPVTNPTWGDVLRLFENAIRRTRDHHHVFLEGIAETSKRGVWTFCSGS